MEVKFSPTSRLVKFWCGCGCHGGSKHPTDEKKQDEKPKEVKPTPTDDACKFPTDKKSACKSNVEPDSGCL